MSETKALTTAKEWLEDLARRVEDLQPLFDHAKVKLSLGKAELRDLVEETGKKLERVRAELRALKREAREPTLEIREALEELLEDIGRTAKRIAEIP